MRISDVVERFGGVCDGDETVEISGITGVELAGVGDTTYAVDEPALTQAEAAGATCVIVPRDLRSSSVTLLRCDSPQRYAAELMSFFNPPPAMSPGVHPSAIIGERTLVNESVSIGPGVVIGENCRIDADAVLMASVVVQDHCAIGAQTVVHPNVTVYARTLIGARDIIHAGAVLGADGFGYFPDEGRLHKWPHIGNVVIEDDVEIGANACVDRAKFGTTLIERGAKIDNLVQIAHNCRIGRGAILAAQTGVSGSVVIEEGVICGGQVGISDHRVIGRGARLGAQSGILADVPPGEDMFGHPARPLQPAMQDVAFIRYLTQNRRALRRLIKSADKG
ncbi:MAG: UDP-3-O-(3-hydroxymyristoyl)glucosamine N-acyltransferase [bacterium]|nr:UDP-3-O-(3-hydroxymyristoyl)glucosamine N-acyltransferase [bacterium]